MQWLVNGMAARMQAALPVVMKDSKSRTVCFTLLHQCWRTVRQDAFPTVLCHIYSRQGWILYGTRRDLINSYNFMLCERLRRSWKCREWDWNSKDLWKRCNKNHFSFSSFCRWSHTHFFFQRSDRVSQMSQRSFVLLSSGTWQRTACATSCSVLCPDLFVFCCKGLKCPRNVHIEEDNGDKIPAEGVFCPSPGKLFSKWVQVMSSGGVVALAMSYTGDVYQGW